MTDTKRLWRTVKLIRTEQRQHVDSAQPMSTIEKVGVCIGSACKRNELWKFDYFRASEIIFFRFSFRSLYPQQCCKRHRCNDSDSHLWYMRQAIRQQFLSADQFFVHDNKWFERQIVGASVISESVWNVLSSKDSSTSNRSERVSSHRWLHIAVLLTCSFRPISWPKKLHSEPSARRIIKSQ